MRDFWGKWDGFSVLLFQAAAAKSAMAIDIHECVALDELPLASADYTPPFLDSDLRVMVPSDHSHSLSRLWEGLHADGHVRVIL